MSEEEGFVVRSSGERGGVEQEVSEGEGFVVGSSCERGGAERVWWGAHVREEGLSRRWVSAVESTVNATLSPRPALDLSKSHHMPTDKAPMVTTNSM